MLPMAMAQSSSGILTIGRIVYWRERGDGSAQLGRSVIYDCLVFIVLQFAYIVIQVSDESMWLTKYV